MPLSDELSKPQYTGLTDEQALAALHAVTTPTTALIPATTVNQLFAQLDLTCTIQDIAATHDHPFRHKMASVILSIGGDHPFNFAVGTLAGDGNLAMLDAMIANLPDLAAKLTQFKATVYAMANKQSRPFAAVTLGNVIAARAGWNELTYTGGKLSLKLEQALPEPSLVCIEASESVDGANWTAFARVAHFYNVQAAGLYIADIPRSQFQRKLRWRGEQYRVVGTVVGV
jgi:hypothetical protein